MPPSRVAIWLVIVTACYRQDPELYATLPEPTIVEGPPGGAMDPEWRAGYVEENPSGASTDPNDPGYAMGVTTDAEIDATLYGYGEWIEIEGYGYVWRPHATVVGVDFTPYETCGTWVWTEYGWTFACEWDWGWLAFHYGRWGWFDDYWAWQPGYEWSPAWVDWRSGGGYVGWRPMTPTVRDHRSPVAGFGGPRVRDHRNGSSRVRDHRRVPSAKDWQWRFVTQNDFGKSRIRAHLFKGLAEGLRVTHAVAKPSVQLSVQPVRAQSIMHARLVAQHRVRAHQTMRDPRVGGRIDPSPLGDTRDVSRPDWRDPRDRGRRPARQSFEGAVFVPEPASVPTEIDPSAAPTVPLGPDLEAAPDPVKPLTPDQFPDPTTTAQPQGPRSPDRFTPEPPTTPRPPRDRFTPEPTTVQPPQPPRRPDRFTPERQPTTVHQPPSSSWDPPSRPTYTPVSPPRGPDRAPTYQPPSRPTYTPVSPPRAPDRAPTYQPPSRPTYTPVSPPRAPTYQPPTRPTYTPSSPPSRAPSSSSSYSPSRSSSSSSSSSTPSRSSSSSSSSYSAPSRSSSSSSSSAPARSSSPPASSGSRGGGRGGFSGGRSHRR